MASENNHREVTPLGQFVQRKIVELGISQNELARDADLSLGGLNKILQGETKEPHPRTLRKLAQALRVPVSDLMILTYPDICAAMA